MSALTGFAGYVTSISFAAAITAVGFAPWKLRSRRRRNEEVVLLGRRGR